MNLADSYDAIPYQSIPFPETHPGHLACLARLHGVAAEPPTRCRVLELGCASGGNLIPMAAGLPDSNFLGIELSPEQAREGAERVAELGLGNCEIRQANILDLEDEGVRFDYIITHGVYSWSPPEVRAKIMALSSQLLSPQGVAYVSFNANPGWRLRGMLRDMLMYQVRGIESPMARLEAAQNYLAFLEAGIGGLDAMHVDYLREEIDNIRGKHPSYLYHEYLEDYNEPLLLQEFIAGAKRCGLDYLCDIDLAIQLPGYLGEQAEQVLSMVDDPLERLQQVDFLLNRKFHQSLLCHKEQQPARFPDIQPLREFAWVADLQPPKKLDLRRSKPAPFTHQGGQRHEVSQPLAKAAVAIMSENFPRLVPFEQLLEQAANRVRGHGGVVDSERETEMLEELFALYAMGIIHARPLEMMDSDDELAGWQMDRVARLGILRGDQHIPTCHHASVNLDSFAAKVIRYLDGETDRKRLLQKLLADFKPGADLAELVDPHMPEEALAKHIDYHLEQLLDLFRKHGVLGAAPAVGRPVGRRQ